MQLIPELILAVLCVSSSGPGEFSLGKLGALEAALTIVKQEVAQCCTRGQAGHGLPAGKAELCDGETISSLPGPCFRPEYSSLNAFQGQGRDEGAVTMPLWW